MRRRDVIGALATCLLVWASARCGQSRKMPHIGVLVSASPPHPFADAFRRGLQSFGYTEGQNIRIEFLYTEDRADRAAQLAAELVRTGVDSSSPTSRRRSEPRSRPPARFRFRS